MLSRTTWRCSPNRIGLARCARRGGVLGLAMRRAAALAVVAWSASGCASDRSESEAKPVSLVAGDFIAPAPSIPQQEAVERAGEPKAKVERDIREPAEDAIAIGTGSDVFDLGGAAAIPTEPTPAMTAPNARPISGTMIVESKVGQINGRPVLASEILEPLDGRLRALSLQQKNPAAWRDAATRLIVNQLISRVRDELVLAEAQANLTSEQRQGLFFFLRKLQENIVSAQGGSAVQADEASLSSSGRSLQQEAQDRLDRQLIEFELRSKVAPRVVVPWRQVRNEYDKQFAKYNPAPIAKFSMIWVKSADAATVARVTESLKTEEFSTIAKGPDNQFFRDKGGAVAVQIKETFEKTELFAMPELTAAAKKLSPGEVSTPVTIRDYVAWIRYDALDRPAAVPLYDAQLEIDGALRERRLSVETGRYFERLFDRGSFSDVNTMATLLVEIAIQRYQPQVAAK